MRGTHKNFDCNLFIEAQNYSLIHRSTGLMITSHFSTTEKEYSILWQGTLTSAKKDN